MSKKKLKLTDERTYYKPFNYPWCYEKWLQHEQMHWLHTEVNMNEDIKDWKLKLNEKEKSFLTNIFRFFTSADIDVAGGYVNNYLPYFPQPEVRMMLLGFGARECFDEETEFLSSCGWIRGKDLNYETKLAQYDVDTKEITFDKPLDVIQKSYVGKMHHYKNKSMDLMVTENHRIIAIHPISGEIQISPSNKNKWARNYLTPCSGYSVGENKTLSSLERLLIAIQADGTIFANCPSVDNSNKRILISLLKPRKIERLTSLLKECNIKCNPYIRNDGFTRFQFTLPKEVDVFNIKNLGFINIEKMSSQLANSILNEIYFWDGHDRGEGKQKAYYNTNYEAVSKVQALAVLSGYRASVTINRAAGNNIRIGNNKNITNTTKDCYVVSITHNDRLTYPERLEFEYNGPVYCATMPKGTLVTRRNGKCVISGNCLHVAAYSHLIETLDMPETIYKEFLDYAEMKDKHDYVGKFASSNDPKDIARSMAVFSAFTEGMQLFSSFILLLNFPRHGKMKGMGQIITWSIKDETLHVDAMIQLFRTFLSENKTIWTDELKKEIYDICRSMVDLEDKFIDLCFSTGEVENLTADEVKQYIRYIADRRLISLGLKGNYKVKTNPLPWVEEMINAPVHTNFFENRSTDYSKGTLTGSWGDVWAN